MDSIDIPVSVQVVIMLGGLLGAIASIFKLIKMIRNWGREIRDFFETVHRVANAVITEFAPNGGKSTKDLLHKIDTKLDDVIDLIASPTEVNLNINAETNKEKKDET